MEKENIYIISDLHLGSPSPERSLLRERHLVSWLKRIEPKAKALFLLGDIFDFWFEYKHVVPKGYIRFLGILAEMVDQGTELHVFTGNHDLWFRDYLPQQLGAVLHRGPLLTTFFGHRYYLAHGDGLGPGDKGYKLMKRVFTHPLSQWLFARLHPNFGVGLALGLSRHGGDHDYEEKDQPHKPFVEPEPLTLHSQQMLTHGADIDYFVYGHRHVLLQKALNEKVEMFILGDWIEFYSYLEITPEGPQLGTYPISKGQVSTLP